jgi:hypothetical protein
VVAAFLSSSGLTCGVRPNSTAIRLFLQVPSIGTFGDFQELQRIWKQGFGKNE